MKNILIIAPSSIPVFGAEAIVNIRLLRALSNCNLFNIDLISRKVKYSVYPYDDSSIGDVKLRSHHIVEVDNKITGVTVLEHLNSLLKFGCVFKGSHWASKALPIAINYVNNNNYDYVLTKNEPSFLIGAYLKRHFGIKWISTWNDPYPECKYPTPYGQGPNGKSFMSNTIINLWKNYADVHIFPCERIRDYVVGYTGIDISKTAIVPHVINFKDISPHLNISKKSKLRLVSLGNLKSPRSCDSLITAVHNLLQENQTLISKLSIDIIGIVENELINKIDTKKIGSVIKTYPPISYQQSLECLDDYDAAIILEAPCEEGIFLPTKVSDYMSRNIPILAISPSIGTLSDLYHHNYIPYFADINSPIHIKNELMKMMQNYPNLKCNRIPSSYINERVVQQYLNF